jgi:hypothetical protein
MAVQTATAIKAYYAEYASGLTGNDAQTMTALCGGNPRKIVFFEALNKYFGVSGDLIDPWGTPYRFDLSDPMNPRVWSCGKNRRDEGGAKGSDDLASWQ